MAVGVRHRGFVPVPVAVVVAVVLVVAACGGSASPETAAPTIAPETTSTTQLEGQVGGGSPAPKPSTTTTTVTTTVAPRPDGFPEDLPLPGGEVGYFTGSPQLGFHLSISTSMGFPELVRFFTGALESNNAWSISVRDVGRGFLGGFEGIWAVYTATDHVLTQLMGEYQGVIEIEGPEVNILLDGIIQPAAGEEPGALPAVDELPRPETELLDAKYSSGLVQTAYAGGPDVYVGLVAAYRGMQWVELAASEPLAAGGAAIGELGNWRVTIRDRGDVVEMDFEDRSLSFP